jgi:hypothetical protein
MSRRTTADTSPHRRTIAACAKSNRQANFATDGKLKPVREGDCEFEENGNSTSSACRGRVYVLVIPIASE